MSYIISRIAENCFLNMPSLELLNIRGEFELSVENVSIRFYGRYIFVVKEKLRLKTFFLITRTNQN